MWIKFLLYKSDHYINVFDLLIIIRSFGNRFRVWFDISKKRQSDAVTAFERLTRTLS